jgi:hypothetical protein
MEEMELLSPEELVRLVKWNHATQLLENAVADMNVTVLEIVYQLLLACHLLSVRACVTLQNKDF